VCPQVLLHCENGFRKVKGFASLPDVVASIKAEQSEQTLLQNAA